MKFTNLKVNNIQKLEEMARNSINSRDTKPSTKEAYLHSIKYFIKFLNRQGLTERTFVDYKNYLRDKHQEKSVSTKNKYLTSARIFIHYLITNNYLMKDITIGVKGFQRSFQHKTEGLNKDEVTKVINFLEKEKINIRSLRLKVILYLLIYNGLRQVEVERLLKQNINLDKEIAYIQGKGRDDLEIIYLHKKVIKPLRKLIKVTDIRKNQVIRNVRNKKPISIRQINREVKNLFSEVGIKKSVHGLRHFYITNLLEEGVDLRDVQKLARHKKAETTIRYDDEINIQKKAVTINKLIKF